MRDEIMVLKFGSSVLTATADLPNAVHEIYRWYRRGRKVVAVVSAIGETTNELIRESMTLGPAPEPHALASLLATGERASAALLGIALDRSGIPARVLDPHEIDLLVAGAALDSTPLAASAATCAALLNAHSVLVIPGFFGVSAQGRTQLLGRGGSDLSAVFLARAFGATRCRLIKDVDGVYEADPAQAREVRPRRFKALSYTDAHRVAGPLIQPKAISFLEGLEGSAEVAAPAYPYESTVHAGATKTACSHPLLTSRVLLLGLGTVGFGVYQRLLAQRSHFRVAGALVRDRARHIAAGVSPDLLHTDLASILASEPDLIVDALPGTETSFRLVKHFLAKGIPVVSANKALIAEHGLVLDGLAERSGTCLRYAAAVGASTPMIEVIDQAWSEATIMSLAAVLNGTCNFVLDRCAAGATLDEAITEARAAGFAEEDCREDLEGKDAERKLRILCRHAFDDEPEEVSVSFLDASIARRARTVAREGGRLKQIARARISNGTVLASVDFEEMPPDSALGALEREWNGIEIKRRLGTTYYKGRGAGRWPTTEAVLADLFDAHRARFEEQARELVPAARTAVPPAVSIIQDLSRE